MVVYNSLARPYTGIVRIPVIKEDISVTDPYNNTMPVQVIMNISYDMTIILNYITTFNQIH